MRNLAIDKERKVKSFHFLSLYHPLTFSLKCITEGTKKAVKLVTLTKERQSYRPGSLPLRKEATKITI